MEKRRDNKKSCFKKWREPKKRRKILINILMETVNHNLYGSWKLEVTDNHHVGKKRLCIFTRQNHINK